MGFKLYINVLVQNDKKTDLDLPTLEAIKNEIIAMDTFRLANHIMEAELIYFQTKDDILLPESHHKR